jgi:hypothetical protein
MGAADPDSRVFGVMAETGASGVGLPGSNCDQPGGAKHA